MELKHFAKWVLSAYLLGSFGTIADAQGDAAKSYIDAVRLNAESLRSYDVLIESTQSDGLFKEINHAVRLKVDYATQRAILFRHSKIKTTSITEKVATVDSAVRSYSCVVDGSDVSETNYRTPHLYKKESFGSALESLFFPVVDRVGIEWFPAVKNSWGAYGTAAEKTQWWSKLTHTLASQAKLQETKDRAKLLIIAGAQAKGRSYSFEFEFQKQLQLPLSLLQTARQEFESGGSQTQVLKRETLKWGNFDGFYVPLEIVGDELISVDDTPDERTRVDRFFWQSINASIEKIEFSRQLQADPQEVLRQTSESLHERVVTLKTIGDH